MSTLEKEIAEARRVSARIHPSKKWEPLRLFTDAASYPTHPNASAKEHWGSSVYQVAVFRFDAGWPFGGGPWAKLGISCVDGQARHDWREFQRIKNQLVGEAWEAVELYPAESRLIDPSNYFYLWCAPSIALGQNHGRVIMGPDHCMAPQRGWHPADEPAGLAKNRKAVAR